MKLAILYPLGLVLLLDFAIFGQAAATKIVIPGLKDEVTVRRDGRGIPYIEAKTDSDLYFAQGYITASDRLWQMDLMRRLARGESAEIFGNAVLEEDKRGRRCGFAEVATQSLGVLTPELRAALEDYARGVNAYIATLDEKSLPIEFKILQYKPRQWTPTDTIVIGKILADALSTTWRNDLLRASLQTLSREKFVDLTNQVTPYDVVLFGKDEKKATAIKSEPHASAGGQNAGLESTNWPPTYAGGSDLPSADADAQTRAESLSRVGLYA